MLVQFKRGFLLSLLALTGLAAVIISLAVYRAGPSGEVLVWAIRGALAYGIMVLMALAAFSALDRRGLRNFALFGLFFAAVMLALLPPYVAWEILEPLRFGKLPDIVHQRMEHLVTTALLTAGLLCLIPFVLIPRMKRVARIVQYTAVLYFVAAYCGTLLALWDVDTEHAQRAVVTLLIPAVTCVFGVFVLQRFFEIRAVDPLSAVAEGMAISCPRCGAGQILGLGESRCVQCRLRISIRVEEPVCPNCNFNLMGLARAVCPECGLHLDAEELPAKAVAA